MAQSGSLSAETEILNQVLRLVEAFRAFDADNDDSITSAELGGIMSSLGYKVSEQDVRSMMQQGDSNHDGLLSIQEFIELNTKDLGLSNFLANSLKKAFEAIDLEGDEFVTGEELYDVLMNMGFELPEAACNEIIASMDADGDGAVYFEDFKLIVSSLL